MSGNPSSPGSQSSLREANAARVVEMVAHYGQITQVELAAATGLSQATISNIVKQLISTGVVETENTVRSGRRAQLVKMARKSGLVAGVQIGRRKLRIVLSDLNRELSSQQTLPLPVEHRADTTLDRAALLIMELAQRSGGSVEDLAAVGVSLPAPVSPVTHQIAIRGIMNGWEDINVEAVLGRRLNRPVVVDNDANAGVWAESRFGALRGIDNGLFVVASYTTGAGILINGRIHRGMRGTAGEIGHVQVAPNGLICVCGARGCLNTVVGADIIVDSLRLSRGPTSLQDIIRAAQDGDPGCRQVINDAGARIGAVLADQATVFEPTRIVVGGELAATGELLLGPMRDAVTGRPLLGDSVEVIGSELGHEAEALGALALAIDASEQQLASTGTEGASR